MSRTVYTARAATADFSLGLSLLLLTSCGAPAASPAASGSPGSTTAPVPPPAATAVPPPVTTPGTTQPGTPASGWRTFTTAGRELSFDYPAGWTVKDPGGALSGDFVDVMNAGGKQMAGLRTNIATGAECTDKSAYRIFDSQPMVALAEPGAADAGAPRYVFESRGEDTQALATRSTIAAYGITMVPEESGATACPMFHLFLWPPSGAFFGGTYSPELNQTPGDPALPYLEKAKLYASTLEYQDIRTMITSLRPADGIAGSAGK
ncbi:hypothetical protein ABIB49_001568 [Arthrobacter sp. UYCu512]|uniref:hypothetical protein n=1 Tax=Arthrobacter sp. UYCu512 TaxID=3156338 RepID=UPI00339A5617